MKCPNCGAEIPEGYMLCEKCGTEIQIVPDFDTEVENSITETLTNLAEELSAQGLVLPDIPEEGKAEPGEAGEEKQKTKPKKPLIGRKFLWVVILPVLAVVGLFIYISVTEYLNSAAYQLSRADQLSAQGDIDSAITALEDARDKGADQIETWFKQAQLYQESGDTENYQKILKEIIDLEGVRASDAEKAYDLLVNQYVEDKEYETLNNALQNCEYPSIKEKYIQYMANAPEFNYIEGAYYEVVPLKMLANAQGTIYYTINGADPTENSEPFISPIFLETGDYVVKAVFISQYGVKSPIAKSVYHVDVTAPFQPEVDLYSGDYYTPQLIHVEAEEGCAIYYTTDGTDPTADSTMYSGFLPMPLGQHTLKFVAIGENMISSEITIRNYNLTLLSDHSTTDAADIIYMYQMSSGTTLDMEGTLADESGRKYFYNYACCVNIPEEGDFYIFSEYLIRPDGGKEKTENYYAVGIYTLPLYKTEYSVKTGTFELRGEQLF